MPIAEREPIQERDRPVRFAVRRSIALEVLWASCCGEDESSYPVREYFYSSIPDLRREMLAFWSDGHDDFSELVILGDQGGVLFADDPEALWAGVEAAAARHVRFEALASEKPAVQEALRRRVERLHDDPGLRERWMTLMRRIWGVVVARGWAEEGEAFVEAAEWELRARLPESGSYKDLQPLISSDWGGRLPQLVREAAAEGREVTVVPAWLSRSGLMLSLAGRLLIGPSVPRPRAGPGMGTRDRARRFKALGDPTRLAIFEAIARRSRTVGELARELQIAQPTVSNHVRLLREAGLVGQETAGGRRLEPDLAAFERFLDEARRATVREHRGAGEPAADTATTDPPDAGGV